MNCSSIWMGCIGNCCVWIPLLGQHIETWSPFHTFYSKRKKERKNILNVLREYGNANTNTYIRTECVEMSSVLKHTRIHRVSERDEYRDRMIDTPTHALRIHVSRTYFDNTIQKVFFFVYKTISLRANIKRNKKSECVKTSVRYPRLNNIKSIGHVNDELI